MSELNCSNLAISYRNEFGVPIVRRAYVAVQDCLNALCAVGV